MHFYSVSLNQQEKAGFNCKDSAKITMPSVRYDPFRGDSVVITVQLLRRYWVLVIKTVVKHQCPVSSSPRPLNNYTFKRCIFTVLVSISRKRLDSTVKIQQLFKIPKTLYILAIYCTFSHTSSCNNCAKCQEKLSRNAKERKSFRFCI